MIQCPFEIIIDTAEQFPFDFRGMKADADKDYQEIEVRTVSKCLGRHPNSLGDYSIVGGEGRCHIERKSMQDFQSTILGFSDGHRERFECELANLSKIEACCVVVECNQTELLKHAPEYGKKTAQENAKILFRSCIAMTMDYRVPITFCDSRSLAQQWTFRFFQRFWEKNLKPKRTRKSSIVQPTLAEMPTAAQLLADI